MLSLFKDAAIPLQREEALAQARRLLVSSLNKGMIPSWDLFFLELPVLDSAEDLEAIKENFLRLTQWFFLEDILNLEATEFFFHSFDKSQRMTYSGEKISLHIPLHPEDWQLWLEIISIKYKQNWNVQNPFCSFFGELYGKNYRFSMIHGSTSPGGISKLMLRCLSKKPHAITSFGNSEILVDLVKNKKNMLVAGSTGSGKTSLLTSLLDYVTQDEHLVVLEDTYEIISEHPHQTRFLSGDTVQTSLRSYLAYSLRLSPDRIILGEMRSHEVVPFLMAMNTGHKGLMGTLHASSAADALNRVALLFTLYAGEANLAFEKVMELICRNLEYVVFMENKKVKEVIKILGSDKGVPFFETVVGEKKNFSF
ncbi:MAG: Flp pilus assembly complex ATPase component TadA [Bdellovibrionales bacterium]|nr:Flp pilus assembly complex ATPase component TadA [Bdellovibrionales bacterium]